MSLWSRFTKFVGKVFGIHDESPPKPPRLRTPGVRGSVTQQPKPGVYKGRLRHQRYRDVWDKVYEDFERSLPATAIEDFNDRAGQLEALFNVWSDPGESEDLQRAAYEEFWDDMADYGYSVADFDWADFKQKYESLGG